MQSRCREWCFGYNLQTVTAVVQLLPPTDIRLGSVFLRTDVRIELFVYALAIDVDVGTSLAVGIVFNRTASVVFDGIEILWHLYLHTEAEHWRNLGILISYHLLCNLDGTYVVDNVSQVQLSRYVGHVVGCIHNNQIVFCFRCQRSQLQTRVLPIGILQLQTGAHVVVGWGTPEVRCQCGTFQNHVSTIYFVLAQVTVFSAEFSNEVFSLHNQVISLVVDYLRCNGFLVHCLNVLQLHAWSLVWVQNQLVLSHFVTGRKQTFSILQLVRNVQ